MHNRFADSRLQCIITEPGLRRQVFYDEGNEVFAVSDPDGCIDEYTYEEALKRDSNGKEALLGYEAIGVFPGLRSDVGPRVSILSYVLAECVGQKGLEGMRNSVSVVADAFCGAGFLGCYVWDKSRQSVLFADPSEDSIRLAMKSFGYNFNFGNVRDKARRDAFTYTFEPDKSARSAVFSVGNPDYLWRTEKIDVILGTIHDIPQVYEVSAANPVMKYVHIGSLCGAAVYLAHSALADELIYEAARKHGARSRAVHNTDLPLCRETLTGAVPLDVSSKLERTLEKKGLILGQNGHRHQVRVSRISWD